ncbi:MAG: hypothetical protein GTO48_09085 [Xanthomonadales bacterium]|nr:hypothetical protein [Xanthomonadales bacterium]
MTAPKDTIRQIEDLESQGASKAEAIADHDSRRKVTQIAIQAKIKPPGGGSNCLFDLVYPLFVSGVP